MSSGGSEGQSDGPDFGVYLTILSFAKIVLDKIIISKPVSSNVPAFAAVVIAVFQSWVGYYYSDNYH